MRLIDLDSPRIKDLNGFEEKFMGKTVLEWLQDLPTVDAVPREELNKLAKKVSDMREAQKRYFKGRSFDDLSESKLLEAAVDATVKAILDPDMTLF